MSGGEYGRAREIFDAAESLEGQAREQFLVDACGDDAALRERVYSLLGARDKLGRFLEIPAVVWRDQTIAGYTVEEVIAEGGMGIVLKATQEQPRRSVAIKLIRGGGFTQQAQQRFELEAEVLGRLDHPGVARIYEAGTTERDGEALPYFVMEYIEGESLTRCAERQHMNERRRIDLMIYVCEAVHHAHLRGVIHRDLKPSNILVREDGQPKVLDFGVARVTDSDIRLTTLHTQVGQILGTLPYMSPEQIGARDDGLDLRSDIYSLGVLTFELLTGRLPQPLDGRELAEAVRVITDEDPAPLSTGGRRYASDLETIVAKCLRKEPDRRYGSAADLAQDLRRYLSNEPISARPASAAYQWSKFARRNRGAVLWAAIALFFLVAGLAFSLASLSAARVERNNAVAAAAEATELSDFLVELLGSPDPRQQGSEIRVRDLLEHASGHAQTELIDDPGVAARVHQALGFSYRGLGLDREGLEQLNAGLRSAERIPGEHGRARQLEAILDLTSLQMEMGQDDSADSLLRRAEELVLHVSPRSALAFRVRLLRGTFTGYAREDEKAERLLRSAYAEALGELGEESRVVRDIHSELGMVLLRAQKTEEARDVFEKELEMATAQNGPDHPVALKMVNNLGMVYKQLEDFPHAKEMLERALDDKLRTLGEEHPSTTTGHHNLALVLRELDELEEAEPHHLAALAAAERLFVPEDPRIALTQAGYAGTLFRMGRHAEARDLYLRCYEPIVKRFGVEHPRVQAIFEELAQSSEALGEQEAAAGWRARARAQR